MRERPASADYNMSPRPDESIRDRAESAGIKMRKTVHVRAPARLLTGRHTKQGEMRKRKSLPMPERLFHYSRRMYYS